MKMAGALIVAIALLASAAVYSRLPQEIPSHWNAAGEVDDTIAKPWGPFVLPLVMIGVTALFLALPRISPAGYEIEEGARALRAILIGNDYQRRLVTFA